MIEFYLIFQEHLVLQMQVYHQVEMRNINASKFYYVQSKPSDQHLQLQKQKVQHLL